MENHEFLETEEYAPLPWYAWEVRPVSVPLDFDEVKTAFALAHGDPLGASRFLKVSVVRLKRWVRYNPRIINYVRELAEAAIEVGAYESVRALFDAGSDNRRREWAATKLMQSRLAMDHMLSPAPLASVSTAVSIGEQRLTVRWGDGTKIAELGPADDGSGDGD